MVYRPLRGPVQSRGNLQPPFITTRCFLKMWHNLGMPPQHFAQGKSGPLPKEYMALAMYQLALYSTSYLIGMHIVISLFIIFLLHYSLKHCHHIIYCHHHPNTIRSCHYSLIMAAVYATKDHGKQEIPH